MYAASFRWPPDLVFKMAPGSGLAKICSIRLLDLDGEPSDFYLPI